MNYQIKAGILYKAEDQRKLAWIKPNLYGQEKKIYAPDDTLLATAGIRRLDDTDPNNEDVRSKEYVLLNADGSRYAAARPQYADGDDPAETGWPVCRMPRVDHAALQFDGADYELRMDNEQNYSLADANGQTCVQIMHRGMVGGWKVWTWRSMPAAFLCGLFVFCRYLEKENEFIVV